MTQPIWSPGPDRIRRANLSRFIAVARDELDPGILDYQSLHHFSVEHSGEFWRLLWGFCEVRGNAGPRTLIDGDKMPGAQWFPDARLNFAENLLRYRDERPAIVFRNETGLESELNYRDLYSAVAATAAALKNEGIVAGDRVAGYLPNLPETVIAMLAATSLGAIWSSCSPDFGINGVVDRLGQIEPKVLFCAAAYSYNGKTHNCLENVRGITAAIPSIQRTIVVPYVGGDSDISVLPDACWMEDFMDAGVDEITFEQLPFDHPLYILYSSGTTGVPKCITHGAGGTLLQHLKELMLHTDLQRDDRLCYFTTCGWIAGPL
jgi:acetoacetyl-CoA synthetase